LASLALAACTTFGAAAGGDASPEASLSDGSVPLGPDVADAANPDATAPLDADLIDGDATVTAPDGQVVNCDEDGDRFAKTGVCGGFDCDDQNANVRPNQAFATFPPLAGSGPGKGGDWNCNGTVEYELRVGVDDRCPLLAFGCGYAGFVANDPKCGSDARFVTCSKVGFGCSKTTDVMRVVGCR
jgi:hypothetical protein